MCNEQQGGYGRHSKSLASSRRPGNDGEILSLGRYPVKLSTSVSHGTAFNMRQLIKDPELEFTKS
jgi:hypothetical protein